MPARSLLAACAAAAVLGPAPAAHAATTCAPPTGPEEFQRVASAQVDLDGARLRSATRFMTSRLALSVRIYRHGCLAATSDLDRFTQHTRTNLWSATKGVVALLAGRAIKQGELGLDDPIGRYLPEADAWFEYAQTTVTLLAAVIQRAVGEDLQAYAQRELLDPLGIPRSHWSQAVADVDVRTRGRWRGPPAARRSTWRRGSTPGHCGSRCDPADEMSLGRTFRQSAQNDVRPIAPAFVIPMWMWSRCATVALTFLRRVTPSLPKQSR